ncbi:MAG: FtsX-like permease family protein [Simkaniaceae bacterium]|nr:FtsX-like permease family protein [Simkaniaceae bacterium]
MFELGIAKKYLVPRRGGLSVSLIAMMSIFVISLVVCLVLLFLSITEGIEQGWLKKLTALNAPLKVVPTKEYYNSYYYQIDSISEASDYRYKSLKEKLDAAVTDPYDPNSDEEPPPYWNRDGSKDLVKLAFAAIGDDVTAQEYEMSGAMMRLRLLRPCFGMGDEQSYLTQVTYLSSMSDKNPAMNGLICAPNIEDLSQLLYQSKISKREALYDQNHIVLKENRDQAQKNIERILHNVEIKQLTMPGLGTELPLRFFPEKSRMLVYEKNGRFTIEPTEGSKRGMITIDPGEYNFWFDGESKSLSPGTKVATTKRLTFSGSLQRNATWQVQGAMGGLSVKGKLPFESLVVKRASLKSKFTQTPEVAPHWVYSVNGKWHLPEGGVILPKSYRDSGVLIGDRGFLSYGASTSSKMQEMRLPIYVAGFYDPGIMAIGAKCIIAPSDLVHTISQSSSSLTLDQSLSAGIHVWFKNLSETKAQAARITKNLQDLGVDRYFQVIPYYEYDFAKDLLQQFQSDKYLFMLIGFVILFVACSNIITLLLLLVNDKKKEIGILQAMGASRKSIACIFGMCGMLIGLIACGIGTILGFLLLKNIDQVVGWLSYMQGHDLFNSTFYGDSLPKAMSQTALVFTLLTTPLVALLAGIVPAIKASRFKTTDILRAE